MAKGIERGAIQPPNMAHRGNRLATSGHTAGAAPFRDVPNDRNKTNRLETSGNDNKGRSPIDPPNEKAKWDTARDARLGWDPRTDPSHLPAGAVPVRPGVYNPFQGDGPNRMLRRDSVKG